MLSNKIALKISISVALAVLLFGGGFYVGKKQLAIKPQGFDESLFWDAYNKLHAQYINKEDIDDQKILYGAIDGMAKSLQDPYTIFFDPKEAKSFEEELAGSFEGIGVQVGLKKGQLTVIAPLKGTPGERAGLKSGDAIIKIDDKSTADLSPDEAVSLIRGKKGTPVTLTIFRDSWQNTKEITIVRDTINVLSLAWELKDGDVAYITIHQFDQPLPAEFKKVAKEIIKSPAQRIILDLRDDPGGYLEVCQEIAGYFLTSGQLVATEDFGHGKEPKLYKAEGNGVLNRYPVVVLINKGSASAAEILAGALRDNRGITLVGEKSFGKGSVQELVGLQDGQSFLKVTIAKWLTPKGQSISEVGLTPDVTISIPDDVDQAHEDPQLEKALEIVKGLE